MMGVVGACCRKPAAAIFFVIEPTVIQLVWILALNQLEKADSSSFGLQ